MKIVLSELFIDDSLDLSFFDELIARDKEVNLEIIYDSYYENAKYLRDIIQYVFTNYGIEKIWVNRFILLSDELNNNAIEYGTKNGESNVLRIKLFKTDENINIEISVEDTGTGANPKTAQEMIDLKTKKEEVGFDNHNSIRGRGLFMIISRLVDELNFLDNENGGLTVLTKKSIEIEKKEA